MEIGDSKMKLYLYYIFTILAAFFGAWAIKIINSTLFSLPNTLKEERRIFLFNKGLIFFTPYYIYRESRIEVLRKECKIYMITFAIYILVSMSYAAFVGWDFSDVWPK